MNTHVNKAGFDVAPLLGDALSFLGRRAPVELSPVFPLSYGHLLLTELAREEERSARNADCTLLSRGSQPLGRLRAR